MASGNGFLLGLVVYVVEEETNLYCRSNRSNNPLIPTLSFVWFVSFVRLSILCVYYLSTLFGGGGGGGENGGLDKVDHSSTPRPLGCLG